MPALKELTSARPGCSALTTNYFAFVAPMFVVVTGALEGTVSPAMGTKKLLSRDSRVFWTMCHIHTHQRMPPTRNAPMNSVGQNRGLRFCSSSTTAAYHSTALTGSTTRLLRGGGRLGRVARHEIFVDALRLRRNEPAVIIVVQFQHPVEDIIRPFGLGQQRGRIHAERHEHVRNLAVMPANEDFVAVARGVKFIHHALEFFVGKAVVQLQTRGLA